MNPHETAQLWLESVTDEELHAQLNELLRTGSQESITDAFFQDLSFGTAGLRGIIGPGTNRMNIYTVGRATQGLANYINSTFPESARKVAIARDSRHKGKDFVEHAASVLAANNIQVYLFPRVEPTPALSFAVRDLGCCAGICMTASHNPAAYNGYKAYGPDGCQITSDAARKISEEIALIDPFSQVKHIEFESALDAGQIHWIDDSTLDRFIDAVLSCRVEAPASESAHESSRLSVVYTPLCGTGLECMDRIFATLGLDNRILVSAQATPDGSFPTCEYPNPEEKAALEEGLRTCKEHQADLLLATDPDADRVGIAVRHNGDYVLLTGNEVGILLLNYICACRQTTNTMPANPIAVSTIVSTAMIDAIARDYGVEVKRTLTGFKYIGDIITALEQDGEEDRFILGFEESYGYLSGTHVRDKDAINAGMLICQMAQHYKNEGRDLVEVLQDLYEQYGYYANRTVNIAYPGAEGASSMKAIMESLRSNPPAQIGSFNVSKVQDYNAGIEGLPPANVVELVADEGAKVIVRPSGTEPKIKLYLFAKAQSAADALAALDKLELNARNFL